MPFGRRQRRRRWAKRKKYNTKPTPSNEPKVRVIKKCELRKLKTGEIYKTGTTYFEVIDHRNVASQGGVLKVNSRVIWPSRNKKKILHPLDMFVTHVIRI